MILSVIVDEGLNEITSGMGPSHANCHMPSKFLTSRRGKTGYSEKVPAACAHGNAKTEIKKRILGIIEETLLSTRRPRVAFSMIQVFDIFAPNPKSQSQESRAQKMSSFLNNNGIGGQAEWGDDEAWKGEGASGSWTDPNQGIGLRESKASVSAAAPVNSADNADVDHEHIHGGDTTSSASHQDSSSSILPAHACAYCGIHNPHSVVRCGRCNKWFCNGKAGGSSSSGSHIVQHLVRAGHKSCALHPESPLGDPILECYACGANNAFLLGFIPSKSQPGVVVLLCREPCLNKGELRDQGWDLSTWEPLIKERMFLEWLVKSPTEKDQEKARPVDFVHAIPALEALWRKKPDATLEDLATQEAKGEIVEIDTMPVQLRYEDGYHYQNVFAPLVKMEAEEDRVVKEGLKQDNIPVRWERGLNKKWLANFPFSRVQEAGDVRVMPGDELKLKLPGFANQFEALRELVEKDAARLKEVAAAAAAASETENSFQKGAQASSNNRSAGAKKAAAAAAATEDAKKEDQDEGSWTGLGIVREIVDGEVVLQMDAGVSISDRMPSSGYTVEIVWRSVTFDRMQAALKRFAVDETSVSGFLFHALLGQTVEPQPLKVELPTSYSAPGLNELNASQVQAVRSVLQRPLSLIQGPPGTGKTLTSATIVYHLCRQRQGQVLVAAPSNTAVDHLTEKIAATGLKVVRLVAKSRQTVVTSVDHLCLHSLVLALSGQGEGSSKKDAGKGGNASNSGGSSSGNNNTNKSALYRLALLKAENGELSDKDEIEYRKLMRRAENDILSAADVICVTCAGAGDSRLAKMRFTQVLIDEATQAAEPECMIPITLGAKQLVLVGDHQQLGPIIMSKKAAAAGLSQSLFERLIMLGIRPLRLQVQYRMHPCLSEFPSNTFYEGTLQNGVTLAERTPSDHDIEWPNPNKPMYFYVCSGTEEMSASGTSYLNRSEAQAVEKIVTLIMKSGVVGSRIGVITPYEGQRAFTVAYMAQNGSLKSSAYADIEVASVDAFQGREKDYIILSTVRSNEQGGIGFLNDPRRLNVALTRAKYGLVIAGNARVLARQPLWHLLISHFKAAECLVEGPLNALKHSEFVIPPPRKAFVPRSSLLLGGPSGNNMHEFDPAAYGGNDAAMMSGMLGMMGISGPIDEQFMAGFGGGGQYPLGGGGLHSAMPTYGFHNAGMLSPMMGGLGGMSMAMPGVSSYQTQTLLSPPPFASSASAPTSEQQQWPSLSPQQQTSASTRSPAALPTSAERSGASKGKNAVGGGGGGGGDKRVAKGGAGRGAAGGGGASGNGGGGGGRGGGRIDLSTGQVAAVSATDDDALSQAGDY